MPCLSAFLTTKRLGFFPNFDLNSNKPKERKDLIHSPLAVFWSPTAYKEIKLTSKPFKGRALRGLQFQMQNTSFRRSGVRREEFKSDTEVAFPPPLSYPFVCSAPFFNSFGAHLLGFISVGK